MKTAKRVPIDVDELSKGDFVSPDRLRSAFSPAEPGSKEWSLKLMNAQKAVANMLTDRYGAEVTVRVHKDGLRVLTDIEASVHNAGEVDRSVRLMRRSVRRLNGVVSTNFTAEQMRQHERRSRKAAMTYLGAVAERQKFEETERSGIAGTIKTDQLAS